MGQWSALYKKLRGGFFLSSMACVTDGSFCAQRGAGCAMVQLGAYLAEPPAYGLGVHTIPVLPAERNACVSFLRDECGKVRRVLGDEVIICMNLATIKLEWGLEATKFFYDAGGDIVEWNFHGAYEPYFKQGKLRAMVYPENRDELFRWLRALEDVEKPIIVKFRAGTIPDYTPIMDFIENLNLFGVHFNIRGENLKPDYKFIENMRRKYPKIFLLVSGYLWKPEAVKRVFDIGADMVGVAEPTMKDPKFIENLKKKFQETSKTC